LAAVFLVSSVTAGNDFLKDRQFRALEKEKDNDTVLVVRDGKIVQLKVLNNHWKCSLPSCLLTNLI
jgi:hypothetical protein